MEKHRVIKLIKATLTLTVFVLMSILGFKRYDGVQLKKMDDADDGFKIGKMKIQIGASQAHATCGMAMNCSGGGGECGMAMGCSGGGGQCGMAMSCSGGGGQCGMSMNCAGE